MNESANNNVFRFQLAQPRLGQRVFVSAHASVSGSVVLEDVMKEPHS